MSVCNLFQVILQTKKIILLYWLIFEVLVEILIEPGYIHLNRRVNSTI